MENSKKPYHHGNLKEDLLSLALKELEEKGIEDLSLRGLARELGVSKNAPYRHFTNKEELVIAMTKVGLGYLYEEMVKELKNKTEINRMHSIGKGYIQFALKHPKLYKLIFQQLSILQQNDPEKGSHWLETDKAYQLLSKMASAGSPMEGQGLRSFTAWAYVHGIVTFLMDNIIPIESIRSKDMEMDDFINQFFTLEF